VAAGSPAYPSVSVIIPVYNDPRRLRLCLECLGAQTYPGDRFEVIVVDNASRESVAPIVSEFPFARSIEEPAPSVYTARNRGLKEARGEVIAFTDADCLPTPRWLERGVEATLKLEGCGIVAGAVDLFPRDSAKPTAVELYEMLYRPLGQPGLRDGSKVATANLFTLRRVVDDVGPFRDGLKTGGDFEWSQRVAARGYALAFCEEALVRHPARRTLREVCGRALRAAGGGHRQATDEGVRGLRLVRQFLGGILGPSDAARLRLLRRYEGVGLRTKLGVVAVALIVRVVILAERLRLLAGGEAHR